MSLKKEIKECFFINLKMESCSGCADDGGVQGAVVMRRRASYSV